MTIIARLDAHPGTIVGDPEELVHLNWSGEWRRPILQDARHWHSLGDKGPDHPRTPSTGPAAG